MGYLRRGSLSRLSELKLRGTWLIPISLAIQLLVFPLGDAKPLIDVGTPYWHVISYLPLLAFVWLNRRYGEILLIGAGIALNLIVILANGGYMPVSPFALEKVGKFEVLDYLREHGFLGNVTLMGEDTRLDFLGDILFTPRSLPFASAFSIGDLLLGLGVFTLIVRGMSPSASRNTQSLKGHRFFIKLLEDLSKAESIREIAETAIRYAIDIIPGAYSGSFLLWDDKERVFRYVAAVGWDFSALKDVKFKRRELLQELIGRGSDVVVIEDPRRLHLKHSPEVLHRLPEDMFPPVFVSVPIRYRGEVLGYFNIDGKHPKAFRREDIEVLRDFQREIELALSLFLGQKELEESEARFRTLFEKAPDAVYITDLEGNILDCNDAACLQSGFSREELLRMNIVRDLAVDPPPSEALNERLRRGENVLFEERKRRKDGSIYYTEVALAYIPYRGREVVISVNRDITVRKSYEDKARELLKASKALFLGRSGEEVCSKAVDFCRSTLEADRCALYLFRDDKLILVGSFPRDFPKEFPSEDELREEFAGEGYLVVPLALGEEAFGFLVLWRERPFDAPGHMLVELFAFQVLNALRVTGHAARIRAFAERLEKLHRAGARFNRCENEKELCQLAVEILKDLLGFDYCLVDLREGDYLVPVAFSQGLPKGKPRKFRLDEGVAGLTYREQRTIWGDPRELEIARPVDPEIRSFISVPVGEYGIIQVVSTVEGAFSEEDVKVVEIVAQQLREALRRVRLEREIREQALRDPLTGLYNRRYLDVFVKKHLERGGGRLGLIILDMNNFKEVNDKYGHTVGDRVLTEVAGFLRENVGPGNVVIRWGGDEFLILVPGATREEALELVHRLEELIADWGSPACPNFKCGFAAGVSSWDPESGLSLDEALREADSELCASKGSFRSGT